MSEEETITGAIERAQNVLKKIGTVENKKVFGVGIEAGMHLTKMEQLDLDIRLDFNFQSKWSIKLLMKRKN
jgi:non-canonical (house-cleaning) NTP pyrophosphatase